MNCEQVIKLMDGYLDGELDVITSQSIEQHLRDCRNCEQAYKIHSSLLRTVSNTIPYYKAPAELCARIQSSLREGAAEAPSRNRLASFQSSRPRRGEMFSGMPWNWLALAATVVFAAIITFNLLPRSRRSGADQFLATQLIASHARSLMANHLTDVLSSDQHTVKPWLSAKLDFSPAVPDLSADGFPLLGGRLDYLENRPVAALVYQRRKHFINLFVWPADSKANDAIKLTSRQGYQLLHWADSDFNYWAVSDVNANDLQTFKDKFEAQTSHH
jgi:anti-sigma factor RsiW